MHKDHKKEILDFARSAYDSHFAAAHSFNNPSSWLRAGLIVQYILEPFTESEDEDQRPRHFDQATLWKYGTLRHALVIQVRFRVCPLDSTCP